MGYLDTYVGKIGANGDCSLADYVLETARRAGERHLEPFDFISHDKGTKLYSNHDSNLEQVFGIICHATDLGFPLFLILTEDRVVLHEQMLQRVKSEMEDFCVCGENDSYNFEKNNLEKPAIVVLKKNYRVLKLWDTVFNSAEYMKGIPIIVVGDENYKKTSFVGKYLSSIKNSASSSFSFQFAG